MNPTHNDATNDDEADGGEDDLALFALGALDGPDAERIASRVAASSSAQRELAAAEELVGSLGYAVPQQAAPEGMRARVQSVIDADAVAPEPVIPFPRRSRAPFYIAALAAALILLLAGVSAVLWQQLQDRNDEVTALQAELDRLASFDADQPLIWTPLVATDGSNEVNGWLCRTPDGEIAWVVLQGPTVDPQHVLQLWLIDEQPHSAGTFVTNADGRGLTTFFPDEPVTDFQLLGITIEPHGGSAAPTTDPIAVAEIS